MNFPKSGEIPRPKDDYVDIPFARDMEDAILQGKKIKTSRNKLHPDNSLFLIQGRTFRIIRSWPTRLLTVRDKWYKEEGFDSPEAFEKRWKQLHRGHFNPEKIVFIHCFEEIDLTYPPL